VTPEVVSGATKFSARWREDGAATELAERLSDFPVRLDRLLREFSAYAGESTYNESLGHLSRRLQDAVARLGRESSVDAMWDVLVLAAFSYTWCVDGQAYLGHRRQDAIRTLHGTQIAFLAVVLGVVGPQTEEHGVAALLRSLSGGDPQAGKAVGSRLRGHLVEMPSGEGKSIMLCVCAIVLALLGADVDVVCYSKILSERDSDAAKGVMSALGMPGRVQYLTFDTAMEQRVSWVRKAAAHAFRGGEANSSAPGARRCRVLLIDEVDVLLDPAYGGDYMVVARLAHPAFFDLVRFVFQRRATEDLKVTDVTRSAEYARVLNEVVVEWGGDQKLRALVREAVMEMLPSRKAFGRLLASPTLGGVEADGADYVCDEQRGLGYVQADGSVAFGETRSRYRSAFAYLLAVAENRITQSDELDRLYLSLPVPIAALRYSDLPGSQYAVVHGVSGTLSKLLGPQVAWLKDVCRLQHLTELPSIYGAASKLTTGSCQLEEKESEWRTRIMKVLSDKAKRTLESESLGYPVVVYFSTHQALNKFYAKRKDALGKLGVPVVVMAPGFVEDAEAMTVNATLRGQITLATREFARGVDFRCQQCTVLTVVQTYLAVSFAEEDQLRRRTGRQGSNGEYHLIVLRGQAAAALGVAEDAVSASGDVRDGTLLAQQRTGVLLSACPTVAGTVSPPREEADGADAAVPSGETLCGLLERCDGSLPTEQLRDAMLSYAVSQLGPSPVFTIVIDTSARAGRTTMNSGSLAARVGEFFRSLVNTKEQQPLSFRETLRLVLRRLRDEMLERVNIERAIVHIALATSAGFRDDLVWHWPTEYDAVSLVQEKFEGMFYSPKALAAAESAPVLPSSEQHIVIIHSHKDTAEPVPRSMSCEKFMKTTAARSVTLVSLDRATSDKSPLQASLEKAAAAQRRTILREEVNPKSVDDLWKALQELLMAHVRADRLH